MMRTGLQGDPGSGCTHVMAGGLCIAQGHNFSMGCASFLGCALAQYPAILPTDDTTNARVGFGQSKRRPGQFQRFA